MKSKNLIPESDFQRLREIGSESPAVMQNLAGMFTEQAPLLLRDLEQAMSTQNYPLAQNTAHALKGVCLNLGFDTTGTTCKLIEQHLANRQPEQAHALVRTTLQPQLEETARVLQQLAAV